MWPYSYPLPFTFFSMFVFIGTVARDCLLSPTSFDLWLRSLWCSLENVVVFFSFNFGALFGLISGVCWGCQFVMISVRCSGVSGGSKLLGFFCFHFFFFCFGLQSLFWFALRVHFYTLCLLCNWVSFCIILLYW